MDNGISSWVTGKVLLLVRVTPKYGVEFKLQPNELSCRIAVYRAEPRCYRVVLTRV